MNEGHCSSRGEREELPSHCQGRVAWLINHDGCREALLGTVTGQGPPLAASVPRARKLPVCWAGGSPTQPRVSLKRPSCQWAPGSEAPPPGPCQLCFFCGPALSSASPQKNRCPRHSCLDPHQRSPAHPSWSAQQEAGRGVGRSVCLLSAPGTEAPGGQGGAETPEGGNVENQGPGSFIGQEGEFVRFAFKQENFSLVTLHRKISTNSVFLNLCM